jgi:N-methylhydantoinase A
MQTHELSIAVPAGELDETIPAQLIEVFEREYEKLFGRGSGFREAGIEMVTFRVHAYGELPKPDPQRHEVRPHVPEPDSERPVYWAEQARRVPTPVYRGEIMVPGAHFDGPAIVELPTTTVAVHPGQHLAVDEFGNFVITES